MYKISEFAKKVNTSVRTLRYYDSIGLFNPEVIDPCTNYRYYSENQIKEYNNIIKLKDLGFTLEEITNNKGHITDDILLKKKRELLDKIKKLESQIKQIDNLRSKQKGKTIRRVI